MENNLTCNDLCPCVLYVYLMTMPSLCKVTGYFPKGTDLMHGSEQKSMGALGSVDSAAAESCRFQKTA